jgi:hypothetical protein
VALNIEADSAHLPDCKISVDDRLSVRGHEVWKGEAGSCSASPFRPPNSARFIIHPSTTLKRAELAVDHSETKFNALSFLGLCANTHMEGKISKSGRAAVSRLTTNASSQRVRVLSAVATAPGSVGTALYSHLTHKSGERQSAQGK